MACELPLANGGSTLVDEDLFDILSEFEWRRHSAGYACRGTRREGKFICIMLHRIVNNTPVRMDTDHINGNRLDNRRENLRTATHAKNVQYASKRAKPSTSKFKGVCWRKDRGTWLATIAIDGRNKNLGTFHDEEEAARAYDRAALRLRGEFARLNFPLHSPRGRKAYE